MDRRAPKRVTKNRLVSGCRPPAQHGRLGQASFLEDIDNPLRIKKMAGSETLYVSQAPVFLFFSGIPRPGAILRIQIHKTKHRSKAR